MQCHGLLLLVAISQSFILEILSTLLLRSSRIVDQHRDTRTLLGQSIIDDLTSCDPLAKDSLTTLYSTSMFELGGIVDKDLPPPPTHLP